MNRLCRLMYASRGLHGHQSSSELRLRGWALLLNFRPYAPRSNQPRTHDSPVHRLNGKRYHEHWLHNLMTSTSLIGSETTNLQFDKVVLNEQSLPVASMKSSRSQDATFCDSGQNLVGSHSGRRHPGIDGSPNHRNKSDRKENTRQPKVCSMPPQGCKVRRARLKISSSGICRGSTADGSAMRLVTTPSRIRWN